MRDENISELEIFKLNWSVLPLIIDESSSMGALTERIKNKIFSSALANRKLKILCQFFTVFFLFFSKTVAL